MTRDNIVPFNPLDKRHLGQSVGQAMLARPAVPITDLESFGGAGIYAIYYHGDFPAYRAISSRNSDGRHTAPIYVGKAVPLTPERVATCRRILEGYYSIA